MGRIHGAAPDGGLPGGHEQQARSSRRLGPFHPCCLIYDLSLRDLLTAALELVIHQNLCISTYVDRFLVLVLYERETIGPLSVQTNREGGLRFAVGSDPRCLLHPSGRHILPFSLLDGRPSRPLSGHLDTATACCLAPGAGLVSGGEDSLLLWWTPGGAGRELPEEAVAGVDVDRWSPDPEAFPEDRGD